MIRQLPDSCWLPARRPTRPFSSPVWEPARPVLTIEWLNTRDCPPGSGRDLRKPNYRAARDGEIDREMKRLVVELERKVRAELLAEVDEALAHQAKGEAVPSKVERSHLMREVALGHTNGG
jgi:hypothetical protein